MKTVNEVAQEELPEVRDLVIFDESEITGIFDKENGVEELFEKLKANVYPVIHDVSDKKNRDQIKSLAYSVSRSKTAVDNYGKELVAGIKEQAKVIDNKRKFWRDECDKLRDSVRAPLTAWENEQQAKIDAVKAKIDAMKEYAVVPIDSKIEDIESRIDRLKKAELTEEIYGDLLPEAKLVKYESIESLEESLSKCIEFHKQQNEKIEQIKQEAIAQEREESRKREEQLKAQAEEAQKKLIIERDNAAAQERARIHHEEQQKAFAEAARQKDIEHRKKINNEILYSICETGLLDEDQAKEFLKLVHNGTIKNLKIVY